MDAEKIAGIVRRIANPVLVGKSYMLSTKEDGSRYLVLKWVVGCDFPIPLVTDIADIGKMIKNVEKTDIVTLGKVAGVQIKPVECRIDFKKKQVFAIAEVCVDDIELDESALENKLFSAAGFSLVENLI
jgi:hypothetical protein